jgi:hypothetical protein
MIMADDDHIKALEGRIAALENALQAKAERSGATANLTPEEIAAFQKVRDVVAADWGEFCGINDCFRCRACSSCSVCRVCKVCRVCDIECSCGPCQIDPGTIRGVGGFNQFGG